MTDTIGHQRAVKEQRKSLATRESVQAREQALIGDVVGNLTGPSGVPWVLARINGDASRLVQAYNATPIIPVKDFSVTLLKKFNPDRGTYYEIEKPSAEVQYTDYNVSNMGGQGAHHLSHEWRPDGIGGSDVVFIYPRALTPLRVTANNPADLFLYILPGWYRVNNVMSYWAGGLVGPFTPPGSGLRYDGVYIDAAQGLWVTPGALNVAGGPPATFALSDGLMPLCAVQLAAGQTAITENDLIQDVRPFLSWVDDSGGGGSSVIAVNRWAASAAQTDFALPDVAASLVTVSDNGSIVDPLSYDLSADGTTLVFTTGRTAGHVIVASYVVETV